MTPAPSFGKRGLKGPPPGRPPPPPRQMRSSAVAVGAVGLLAFGFAGAAGFQEYRCWPPEKGQPDERPQSCFEHSHSSGSGGHGFYSGGGGGGAGSAHASFGGFGAHGSGHGGGT